MDEKKVSMNSIMCVQCKEIKAVRKDVFLARIKKYGSVEKLLKAYRCQRCRNGTAKRGIQCSKCKEIKAVRKDVYKQRIERYKSEEELLKRYLCRKCRKIVKHQKRVKSKRGVHKDDISVL